MKILMLHTGGTISCTYENGVLSPRADIVPTVNGLFRNCRDVRLTHKRICSVLSENTDGRVLNKLVSGVAKYVLSGKYDGVIVTLGSDTLAYTSAAIAYTVGLSKTPCITVSSNLPITASGADGIANLKAAVAVLRSKRACGVLTVYPEKDGRVNVYRATRILQQPPYRTAPLSAGQLYGTVANGEFSKNEAYAEQDDALKLDKVHFSMLSPVFLLGVYPGMIYPALPKRIKAVILSTYHSGTLNTASEETVRFARRCKKRGIRVYVGGISDSPDYESMRLYGELGFTRLPTLSSPAAMLVKLWLMNSGSKRFSDEGLFSPLGGDLSVSGTAASPDKDTDIRKTDTEKARPRTVENGENDAKTRTRTAENGKSNAKDTETANG